MNRGRRKRAHDDPGTKAPGPAAGGPPASPLRYRIHLTAAALVLIFLASHRCATVVSEPRGRFEDPDAQFHARRVVRTIQEGRLLPPATDAFENFPDGGRAVWPPLHDASVALFARLGGSTSATPERGMRVAAAFPVVELVLVLLAAAALARGVSGGAGGALAAWLVATAVCLFRRGAFGEIDHNVTEVLGGLLLTLLALRLFSDERTKARPWLVPILWASGVLLAMGFFAGLVLASGLVAAGHLAVDLFDAESAGRRSSLLSAGYALAALALPFTSSWRVRPDPGDPWRLGPVYVLILAAAAAGTAAGALVAAVWHRRLSLRAALLPAGSLLAAAVVALTQDHRAFGGFAKGLGFIGARDPWLSTIDEFQPLLADSSAALVSALPALLVGAIAVALAFAALPRSKGEEKWPFVAIAVPFVLYMLLALAQKRFLPPAAAFAAAAAGAAWIFAKGREAFRWAVLASLVAGLLAASSNLFAYAGAALRNEAVPEVSAGEAAGAMLLQTTPDPGNPPAWGVLAPWEYGHPILWTSGRPVALNNFGSFHPGFARATHLFLETSPSRAVAELSAMKLRYVVAAYAPNVVPSAARSLGEDPRRTFPDGYDPRRVPRYLTTAEGDRTLAVRLHRDDAAPLPGDDEAERAALRRFKKVWESPEEAPGPNGAPIPFMKLFELLPPA